MNGWLYRQNVDLAHPVSASAQEHQRRSRLFLVLEEGGHLGYGEVAPQASALNGDPGFDDVVGTVKDVLTRLTDLAAREGAVPSWSRMARVNAASPASNVATALVEMALLDRELRVESATISERWPERFDTPTQITVSLLDDADWTVDASVARVRLKSAPGPISARALDRLSGLEVPVLVDFNCSATSDDDVFAQIALIREVATIAAVEQPFRVGNVIDHARLASLLEVPISLDEGVRSVRDLTQIANYHAAAMICVKPARVGGLASARAIFAKARELGLRAYLGGFFESPYARRVHCALAHSCVSEPSDLPNVEIQPQRYGEEVTSIEYSFGVEPSASMLRDVGRLWEIS